MDAPPELPDFYLPFGGKLDLANRWLKLAQIRENPYLQYFLGLHEYLREDLFDASMMVHFRKRISPEALEKINNAIVSRARQQAGSTEDPPASPPVETPPPLVNN